MDGSLSLLLHCTTVSGDELSMNACWWTRGLQILLKCHRQISTKKSVHCWKGYVFGWENVVLAKGRLVADTSVSGRNCSPWAQNHSFLSQKHELKVCLQSRKLAILRKQHALKYFNSCVYFWSRILLDFINSLMSVPTTFTKGITTSTRGKNLKQNIIRSGSEDMLDFVDTYLVSCMIYNTHVFSIF